MQPQSDPFIVPLCEEEIDVIYQDDVILLINKPSGLLTLSGKHPLNKDSVHFRLVQDFPTATMLHRLDFGTSGVMLVALNKQVNALLTKQFQARTIAKTYHALLHGHLTHHEGMIEFPIIKDEDRFPLQKVCYDTGKAATSQYKVIETNTLNGKPVTKVKFTPITGRTHQLRIHSQQIGHPILGCDLYATDEAFFMAKRLMLHATTLTFDHPVTNERLTIESECPF